LGSRRANPEAVAEHERALALDPSNVEAAASLGFDYMRFGEFDKSFEYFDNAIRESPHDPWLAHLYGGKAFCGFGRSRPRIPIGSRPPIPI
jgi:Tfp pilus assembly protein PilF